MVLDHSGTAPRLPPADDLGARPTAAGTAFRVWAPSREAVSVAVVDGPEQPLVRESDGYWAGEIAGVRPGARYGFRLDADRKLYPDPASRFQPEGPHDPSEVIDPAAYAWRDAAWPGTAIRGQVMYELHVGTFTPEGTWAAAAGRLSFLKEVGVTCIEMMPVAEFGGAFGWGYDGVNLFAPTRLYGRPDDLRAFVDAAHALGLAVILDVVYNHLGPDGNYLACFTKDYFTAKHQTDWGEAINFDGPEAGPVRDYFVANAAYWIREFHFDGLRLDATQNIYDDSPTHVIADIGVAARHAAGSRSIIIVAENEPQEPRIVRPLAEGGYGLDSLWNDDFHHSAMVAMTGRAEAYYEDHEGTPQEFVSAAKYGYLFQGQVYAHQGQRRGQAGLDLDPTTMVTFLQNHDQIANSATGRRCHQVSSRARARAMTALFLLMPGTPMLFQGQEFWSSAPFYYFADHDPDLARMVREGRYEFLSQFPSIGRRPEMRGLIPDPAARATFEACRLDWRETETHAASVALHRDLLSLRRDDPVFAAQTRGGLDGAVLGPDAFVLRFFGAAGDDRALIVNLGRDLVRRSFPEPLLAPPAGRAWRQIWSSEHPSYGGSGTPEVETTTGWYLPAEAAVVFGMTDSSDPATKGNLSNLPQKIHDHRQIDRITPTTIPIT